MRRRLARALACCAAASDDAEGGGEEGGEIGLFLVPWADNADNEARIKDETKATLRCYPFSEQHRAEGRTCFFSGEPATHMALFARAY